MTLFAKAPGRRQESRRLYPRGGTVVSRRKPFTAWGRRPEREAVARIFEIKKRPRFDPLIVHVASIRQANPGPRQPRAEALMKRFWPGPLTLVLPKRK